MAYNPIMHKWPLAVPSMTTLDKLKIGYWLLTQDHWSAGEFVRDYEKRWEEYTGCPYVVMVHSGSAANFLIAQKRKDELIRSGEWPMRNNVLFPAVTWISSISPWVQQGFVPVFMDVSANMCSSSDQIASVLTPGFAAVFYTSLLGFSADIEDLQKICSHHDVPLYMDNCESSFTTMRNDLWRNTKHKHICNFVTSSTSLYFSHHTSGNQEGGLIFCRSSVEANWYRMARNHGMTRGMPDFYKNADVDPRFDFYIMGSNHRTTNLAAYMASLDLDRALEFSKERQYLSNIFTYGINTQKYEQPHRHISGEVPLVIPIIAKYSGLIEKVKSTLDSSGIEWRPIVGGNMLRHTALGMQDCASNFPRAQHIHDNGLYVGLHRGVTPSMVRNLTKELNSL